MIKTSMCGTVGWSVADPWGKALASKDTSPGSPPLATLWKLY